MTEPQTEKWNSVRGFVGIYEVSNAGRVRRICGSTGGHKGGARVGRILKPQNNKGGYLFVQLWREGRFCQRLIHCIVAEAFLGDAPAGTEVNHIDGNKRNNCLTNLEFLTRSKNNAHAYRIGLRNSGETHQWAKLTWKDVHEMRRLKKTDSIGCRRLARRFGVNKGTVLAILSGKTWKYAEENR